MGNSVISIYQTVDLFICLRWYMHMLRIFFFWGWSDYAEPYNKGVADFPFLPNENFQHIRFCEYVLGIEYL